MCDSDSEVDYRDAFPVCPTNRTINPTDVTIYLSKLCMLTVTGMY